MPAPEVGDGDVVKRNGKWVWADDVPDPPREPKDACNRQPEEYRVEAREWENGESY